MTPLAVRDAPSRLYLWLWHNWKQLGDVREYFSAPTSFRVGSLVGTFEGGRWSVRHERQMRWHIEYGPERVEPAAPWDPLATSMREPTYRRVRMVRDEISRKLVEVVDPDKESDAESLQDAMNAVPKEVHGVI
jgi:hypothetical protein